MIFHQDKARTIYQGDCRHMTELEDNSIHMCVTSPPYWNLRRYSGIDGEQLGSEPTPELYIQHIVEIFREVRRVLRPDGTLWLNIGDSMAGSGQGKGSDHGKAVTSDDDIAPPNWSVSGLKPLDRVGIPERLVLALQQDDWYWRSTIIWNKTNTMPESVAGWRWTKHKVKVGNNGRGKEPFRKEIGGQDHAADGSFKSDTIWQDCPGCPQCIPNDGLVLRKGNWRPTDNFEYIYQLAKAVPYYGDGEAVRQPYTQSSIDRADNSPVTTECPETNSNGFIRKLNNGGANLRAVWTFPSRSCGYEHYAAFPLELPLRCIKAGTSEYGVCAKCGSPWARVIDKPFVGSYHSHSKDGEEHGCRQDDGGPSSVYDTAQTLGWRATCSCNVEVIPAIVLDPFAGTGTTLEAATKLGRRSIGVELSLKYCEMIRDRNKQGALC